MDTLLTQIEHKAMEHFFRMGIRSLSMDDLCQDLGISKKTLYQHITNKEQLVDTAINNFIHQEKDLFLHLKANSLNALHEMSQMAQHIIEMFGQIKPILTHDLQKYYKKTWEKVRQMQMTFAKSQIQENLCRGIEEGLYRKEIDPDIVSSLYVEKSLSLTNEELFSPHSFDRQHLVKQHLLYHIYGILSDAGREHFNTHKIF